MGAWGDGIFENDTALDFLGDMTAPDFSFEFEVGKVAEWKVDEDTYYLPSFLVLAEFCAFLWGRPTLSYPDEFEEIKANLKGYKLKNARNIILLGFDKFYQSQFYLECEGNSDWLAGVRDIESRLRQKKARRKRRPKASKIGLGNDAKYCECPVLSTASIEAEIKANKFTRIGLSLDSATFTFDELVILDQLVQKNKDLEVFVRSNSIVNEFRLLSEDVFCKLKKIFHSVRIATLYINHSYREFHSILDLLDEEDSEIQYMEYLNDSREGPLDVGIFTPLKKLKQIKIKNRAEVHGMENLQKDVEVLFWDGFNWVEKKPF